MDMLGNKPQIYLTWNSQRIIIDGLLSAAIQATSGVPRVSEFAPLFFLLSINDILQSLKVTRNQCVDNCLLSMTIIKTSM